MACRVLRRGRRGVGGWNWSFNRSVGYAVGGAELAAWEHPGPGVPSILHALSQRHGRIKRTWMFAPLITSSLSVGLGGSGGLEGPSLQSAAAIGSEIGKADQAHVQPALAVDRLCGVCIARSALQSTGRSHHFCVEVIMIDLTASSLVPLLLASLTALITATALMGDGNILTPPIWIHSAWPIFPCTSCWGSLCGAGSVVFSRLYLGASAAVSWLPSSKLSIWAGGAVIGGPSCFFPRCTGRDTRW